MPDHESEINRLWELADFESLTSMPLIPSNSAEENIIKEAQAAIRLLNDPSLGKSATGRRMVVDEKFKTVTILHSSLPLHPGGYSNRAQGLLQGISKLGVSLSVYTRPGFYRERAGSDARLPYPVHVVEDIKYHHLADNFRRGGGEFQYMESCIEIYKQVLCKERPNVLHVRSTFLIALPAIIAAKSLNIPVVYEVSGLWELVYEGRGEFGRSNRAARMENSAVLSATRTVTTNTAMAELLKKRIGLPIEIGIVPNAVDLTKFSGLPSWEEQQDKFDLGYIGSLVDYEGLDTLLLAISHLRTQGFSFSTKIVGKGKELRLLKEMSKSLGIDDLVTFTGPVPADQVQQHFAQIRTIVLPRRSTPATECVTPLKPFEAMAAKRALITSDVSALRELSRNGKATTVFKQGDHIALADAIVDLEQNPEQRESQVDTAFEIVKNYNSWDNIGQIMETELRQNARAEYWFTARRSNPNQGN